jgi:hypothetical protein
LDRLSKGPTTWQTPLAFSSWAAKREGLAAACALAVLLDACQIMLNVALRAGVTVEAFEQTGVGMRVRLAGDEALENQAFTRSRSRGGQGLP